tara:strand:- start:160 stop:864 length:705 start_codon:yes stop_codon:yes gene_type:complete
MSKVKKNQYKSQLSYEEIIVVKLKSFSLAKTTGQDDKQKAVSLIKWFQLNNYLTAAQKSLANQLTYVKKKAAVVKKHYLYAISNGQEVKLGMSSNVNGRLNTLQTSSPSKLSLLWKYYIANTSKDAIKIEKMLHRACNEFHIRGEWFTMDCINIVNSFNPNKKHTAKWEYAKLISVATKRKSGILNFTVEDIRRTKVLANMNRVWEQKDTAELYQLEVKKYLDDGQVVLVIHGH